MRTAHRAKRSTVAAGTFVTDIDHLQIAAPKGCEAQARYFFGEILGLAEIEKPESLRSRGGCWFRLGSMQLHIGVEERFRPARKPIPPFRSAISVLLSQSYRTREFSVSGTNRSQDGAGFTHVIRGEIAWSSRSLPYSPAETWPSFRGSN
jgi:hypothetical protein